MLTIKIPCVIEHPAPAGSFAVPRVERSIAIDFPFDDKLSVDEQIGDAIREVERALDTLIDPYGLGGGQ